MSEKIEDFKKDSAINLDEASKSELDIKDEVAQKEVFIQEKPEGLDARGERIKSSIRRKKLEEMASKYMDTFYDGYNKHISEIDEEVKRKVAKNPNIIKRFFGFIKRLFGGKKKNNLEALKNFEPKNIDVNKAKKQMEISKEEMEKYDKEIANELQQAVEREKLKREYPIEEIQNEPQGKKMEHKL